MEAQFIIHSFTHSLIHQPHPEIFLGVRALTRLLGYRGD